MEISTESANCGNNMKKEKTKQIIIFAVILLINIIFITGCIRCWILKIDVGSRFTSSLSFLGYIEVSVLFIYLIVKEIKDK